MYACDEQFKKILSLRGKMEETAWIKAYDDALRAKKDSDTNLNAECRMLKLLQEKLSKGNTSSASPASLAETKRSLDDYKNNGLIYCN